MMQARRRSRYLWQVLAVLAIWAGFGWGSGGAQADVLTLTSAHVTVTINGAVSQSQAVLPYDWDSRQGGVPGYATFELRFDRPAQNGSIPEPYGLYIRRVGTAYELWLNGILLQKNGSLQQADGADYAKSPRYVAISPASLQANNVLQLRVRADVSRKAGVSPLLLGPEHEVYGLFLADYRIRSTGSLVVLVLSLAVGFIALMLWLSQRIVDEQGVSRRESLFLWAALAELCWSVSIANHLIEVPPLPTPWWGMLAGVATAAWACCMALFCMELAGWQPFRRKNLLPGWFAFLLIIGFIAAYGAAELGLARLLTSWYLVFGCTFLIFIPVFVWRARRAPSAMVKLLAASMVINMMVGFYDLYVLRLSDQYGAHTYLRYSSVLFGLSLGYFVLRRFREIGVQAQSLNLALATRVAEKEAELALSFGHLERFAREQERLSERARILSEVHDSVGGRVSLALGQLKSGEVDSPELLQTLRDSLEQLKLTIDALTLPQGDVTALLAGLRYRLEPRFRAQNLTLEWDLASLPIVPRLEGNAMRQLQMVVFEAISNVLRHAGARSMRLSAQPAGDHAKGVSIHIVDDGCGFDPHRQRAQGLTSMQKRAAAIGATLSIHSEAGRTQVVITLE